MPHEAGDRGSRISRQREVVQPRPLGFRTRTVGTIIAFRVPSLNKQHKIHTHALYTGFEKEQHLHKTSASKRHHGLHSGTVKSTFTIHYIIMNLTNPSTAPVPIPSHQKPPLSPARRIFINFLVIPQFLRTIYISRYVPCVRYKHRAPNTPEAQQSRDRSTAQQPDTSPEAESTAALQHARGLLREPRPPEDCLLPRAVSLSRFLLRSAA